MVTFNIIYTPGTVFHLLPFVQSVLRHSTACFRLIDNGCMVPEHRMLDAVVKANDRLELWQMPGEGCRPHGEVLNALFALETQSKFCILDSDIVLSGPFLDHLATTAEGASAAFSGAPVWMTEKDAIFRDDFQSMTGEYLWDARGACLGCTYMAVYDRTAVKEVMDEFGVHFGGYRWGDLSPAVQRELTQRGRKAALYDTAKVMNAMLPSPGRYISSENVHHLGGFSFPALRTAASSGRAAKGRLARLGLSWTQLPKPVQQLLMFRGYSRFGKTSEALAHFRRRVRLRDPVRKYFHELLRSLSMGTPIPKVPDTGSSAVNARLAAATDAIIKNHGRDTQAMNGAKSSR